METICINCQILFSWVNKKTISKCRLLKFLPRVLGVKYDTRCLEKVYTSSLASYQIVFALLEIGISCSVASKLIFLNNIKEKKTTLFNINVNS